GRFSGRHERPTLQEIRQKRRRFTRASSRRQRMPTPRAQRSKWQTRFSQSDDVAQPKTIRMHLSLGLVKSEQDWAGVCVEKAKDRPSEGASDVFESKLKEARQ